MYYNAPSHISKLTHKFFEHVRFIEGKIMEWPPSSPDLNLIGNLWSVVKMKLYKGAKQYNSKADIWKETKTITLESKLDKVKKKLTKSMYSRLLTVNQKKGHYIQMLRIGRHICYLFC